MGISKVCHNYISSGTTPDVSWSAQIIRGKGRFLLLMPYHEAFHVWVNRDFRSVKENRLKWGTQRKWKDSMGRSLLLKGSYPHPGRAGSCRFPTSRPCTRLAEQGPGIPTPPERILCQYPWMSTVPEMKIHFTKGPWGEFLFAHKMTRGEG